MMQSKERKDQVGEAFDQKQSKNRTREKVRKWMKFEGGIWMVFEQEPI